MIRKTTSYVIVFACVTLLAACSDRPEETSAPAMDTAGSPAIDMTVTAPPWAANTSWLAPRAEEQRTAAATWEVFHDFQFTDRQPESGIDFLHRVVDDAARDYKAVHYDHGTGVAIADVDGDGLHDIYFVNQVGSNELWKNLGDGTFTNVTGNAGVAVADRISVGAAFADTDNDGDSDLFVTTVRGGNILFENNGGKFSDVTEGSLGYKGHSSGAVFLDYNRDGLVDLFVTNIGEYTTDEIGRGGYYIGHEDAFTGHTKPERERDERSILYRNEGSNRFTDVTDEVGLIDTRWSGDAAPIDANNDGWTDIYVISMQGLDGYWENQGGERFIERSAEVFPRSSWGAMGIQVFDFDNDGDQDIYITDMHSDMADEVKPTVEAEKAKVIMTDFNYSEWFHQDGGNGIWGNSFFRNNGDGTFTEISDEIGAENFWPWGLSTGDLNADGYQDAFVVSSMNLGFRYGINSLLLNDAGNGFVDAEFVLGVEPRRDGATFADWFILDCAGADSSHRLCPKEGNVGKVTVRGAIGSRSSVIFDIEGDGDLDIVTNDFHTPPMVLISNLSEQTDINYLSVNLAGSKSNRDGLGAIVEVTAGDRTITQVRDGQSGYLSQSVQPLYFGLAAADTVEQIRIRWPSGDEQVIEGPIQTNQTIVINEAN